MKKVLLLLIITTLGVLHGFAQLGVGQQMQNNNFESWTTENGHPVPNRWHSIKNATGGQASTASGVGTFVAKSGSKRPGGTGSSSVRMTTEVVDLWLVTIPANGSISTGRFNAGSTSASNTKNCTYTSTTSGYNQVITSYPDSVYVWTKTHLKTSSHQASLNVVIHNNVVSSGASNNAVFQDPTPENASNSVVNTSGSVNDSKIVAKAYKTFNTNGSWVQQKIAFTYPNNNTTPSYVLTTFSTNKDAGVGNKGDSLIVDDIVLIYNTRLQSLNVNGNSISNFNPNVTTYTYPTPVCAGQWPTVVGVPRSPRATASISHDPTVEEPYTIIKVTHKNQESDENVTKYYRINYTVSAPTITLSNNGSYAVCAGESVTMTASGASSYTWSNSLGSGASKTVTPTATTQYTVTGTDANGCQGTAVAYVTVNQLPNFSIVGVTTICSGNSATLTGSNAALNYAWSTGETTTSINVSAAGTYTVEGTDPATNCKQSKSVEVSTSEMPEITVSGVSTLCSGATLTLTASSSVGGTSFVWTDADNQQIEGAEITVSKGGNYTVSGTANGCTGTATRHITVNPSPVVTISGNSVICGDESVELSATSNISNTTFTWSDAGATEGNVLTVNAAGSYTVTGVVGGCTGVSAPFVVTTSEKPAVPQTQGAERCDAGNVELKVLNPNSALTYNWYANESSQNIIYTGVSYTTNVSATSKYYVAAQNEAGCSSQRVEVAATVVASPAAPAFSQSISYCGEGDYELPATYNNSQLFWYSDQNGESQISANQHITSTTTFYCAVKNGNCTSGITAVPVTIKSVPDAPQVTEIDPICSNTSSNVSLSATPNSASGTIKWYNSSNTYLGEGVTYQARNIASSTVFYATETSDGCESAKATVNIVKNPLPEAPVVSCEPICGAGNATFVCNATGVTLKWLDSDNQLLGTGSPFSTPITQTTAFKAVAVDNATNCESLPVSFSAVVNNVFNTTDVQSACEQYVWQGDTYTTGGEYTKTLQSVSGCDSVVTLILSINPKYNVTRDTTVCDAFVWQGDTYTNSGIVTKTLQSVNGCDSVVNYNLTVKHTTTSSKTIYVCENELPYNYEGTTIETAGNYTIHYTNAEGCDSTLQLTVVMNAQPGQPTLVTSNTSRCGAGNVAITLTAGANGNRCLWYASQSAVDSLFVGNTYSANYSESTTLFVTTKSAAGCESERKAIDIVVNAVPQVPVATCEPRCGAGEVVMQASQAENATTCRWYQNQTISTVLYSGYTYTRNIQNTSTFYVESYNENTNCKSQRVAVVATVKPVPAVPQVTNVENCGAYGGDLSENVTYSNVSLRWYTQDDELISDSEHYNANITETTTLKVSAYNEQSQCESAKSNITITINDNYAPLSIYDTTCQYSEYTEHGQDRVFDVAGDFDIVLNEVSSKGCDSVVTLHLNVMPVVYNSIDVESCDYYEWNNLRYEESGVYDQAFTSANGCDSLVTMNLVIKESVATSFEAEGCEEYVWNSSIYSESGDYEQTFTASNDCDSVVTMHLDIYRPQSTTLNANICVGDIYNQNGFYFEGVETGSFTETLELTTSHNCDSTVTLNIVVNPVSSVNLSDVVCAGTRYTENGFDTMINVAGTYILTNEDKNVFGCDSITTLTLKVNPTYQHTFNRMICENASYYFNGQNLTEEGTYSATFSTVDGCDSLVTLVLTIGSEYNETINAHVCYGGSYNQFGFNYTNVTENITAQHSSKAVNGCDSVTILNLVVVNPSFTDVYDTICQGVPYNRYGFNVNTLESKLYEDTKVLVSSMGCDSTVTLHLLINPVYDIHQQVSACKSDEPYYYEPTGSYFNVGVAGTYDTVLSYKTVAGCDSNVTVSVTVLPTYNVEQSKVLCDNSEELPYMFGDQQLTVSGVHTHTFVTAGGCDSVVTLNFVVNETKATDIEAAICLGDSYEENGFSITPTEAGTSSHTMTLQCVETGCDSVVTLTLTVNPSYNIAVDGTICVGERYTAHGFDTLPAASGVYTIVHEYETEKGCDSVITLNLVVNEPDNVTYNAVICQGETFSQFGFDTLMNEAGTFALVHNSTNALGCDSVTTVNLTVNPVFNVDTTVNICDNELPFLWNNDEYYNFESAGDHEIVFSTVNGCDSIINLHLNVHQTYSKDTTVTVCQGALPYLFCEGFEFATSGEHEIALQTTNGCDSVWTLNLVVSPNTELYETQTVCADEMPYQYKGQTFEVAGVYDIMEEDDDHCITITHLTLVVNEVYESTDAVEVCEEDLPLAYGDSTFMTSGVYDVHFQSVAHCDSVVTLTVNVIPTARESVEMTYCESEFPVSYGGRTFDSEGEYEVVFSRDGLCDSVVTLTLNKSPEYLFTETQTLCEHELPYIWHGRELSSEGVYYDSLTTITGGCDSVYKIQLNINPTQVFEDENIVLCEGETETWRGLQVSESGTYYDTVNNSVTGCYDVYRVEVIVNPTYLFEESATVCSDDLPYLWRGMSLTESCVKEVILQTTETYCDSIYRLTLTVNNSYHATENVSVCDYDLPHVWHGKSLTESGVYYDTIPTIAGCDSTFVLNLTVNASTHESLAETVCESELPYFWRGHNLTAGGVYYDSVANSAGCTDVFELDLTVLESTSLTVYDTLCAGGYYSMYGFDTAAVVAGTMFLQQKLTNAAGCDSTLTVMLSVMPSYKFETTASTCENTPFEWRGGEYIAEGVYYDSLVTEHGCDSIYVLNLIVNPTYDIFITDTALRHHEYVYGDFVLTPADSGTFHYDIPYQTVENCDSIVHLTLYVAYNYGVEDIETMDFNIYPNPASAMLNISGERMRIVEIYSMTGKLVYRSDVDNPDFTQVDVRSYPSGNYFVRVTLEDNTVVNAKVLVTRR